MGAESAAEGLEGVIRAADYRAALEAVRDRLAASLEVATEDPRRLLHVAPIAKALSDVLTRLDELPAAEGSSASDDLRARRAARLAAASGS